VTQRLPAPDLAALPTSAPSAPPRPRGLRRLALTVLPPLVVFAAVIGLWYAGSYLLVDPALRFLLPPPDAVVRKVFSDPANVDELLRALAFSAEVAMIGLLVATALGMLAAIVMSQARWAERSLFPYAVVLQTIPILAIVPLFGYWFGFGLPSRVLTCVLISLFPIIANTLFGLRSVDPALHDLFTLHGAGRFTRLVKLQLPAATPAIITGLRISAGLSVIGAIVGDLFFQQGQPGLGQLIYLYPKRLQSEMLFAAVILASLFGLVVFVVFGAIGRRLTSWHESAHDRPPSPPVTST
jgi:NitT/TauT family transport system permease protein